MPEKFNHKGPTCECGTYDFPHRLMGGDCNGRGFVREVYENTSSDECDFCALNKNGAGCEIVDGIEEARECPALQAYVDSYGIKESSFHPRRQKELANEIMRERQRELHERIKRLTCRCKAYNFPHRFGGGKCSPGIVLKAICYVGLSALCTKCDFNTSGCCALANYKGKYKSCPAIYEYVECDSEKSIYEIVAERLLFEVANPDISSSFMLELDFLLCELEKFIQDDEVREKVPF